MTKIIAITNQKGGVGKTTTSVNLAASLVALTRRDILLIDLDPQGNATVGSGLDKELIGETVNEVLLGEASIQQAIVSMPSGYDLLPATPDLTMAEVSLLEMPEREHRLRQALISIREKYDFILIDCPPALNMLTVNALVAADSVLIPMQCEYYALEGLSSLIKTIEEIRKSANPALHIEGLLRTLYDGRTSLTQDVSKQLQEHFGEKLYQTVIPRNVRLAEAPSYGLPALLYDKQSSGAVAYLALAQEILDKHQAALQPQATPLLKHHAAESEVNSW
ncbi:MAG: ParA family protein [Gammaproteobacteria bacterium]